MPENRIEPYYRTEQAASRFNFLDVDCKGRGTATTRAAEISANWSEQALAALERLSKKLAVRGQQMLRLLNLEREVGALKERVDRLESSVSLKTLPVKRVGLSPKIRWLRENRSSIMSTYAGMWIAVADDGVVDSDASLSQLFERVRAIGKGEAVNYVKVSRPFSPE